jgi:tetratricopeptide (TPR) repeat protein
MTALANFRHRFEEAIRWSIEAEKAYPEDTSVRAMRVEALLTLDRLGEAEQELAGWVLTAGEFHLRAATARVLLAKDRRSDAVDLYLQAAGIAEGSAPGLAQWSLVRAAAAYIDSGAPDRARPILERALDLGATSLDAQVHMAEVEEAGEDPHRALARLEVLLRDTADPTVAAAAARLARKLGDAKSAERHFRAAETVFRKALTAGEQYTLGALARLQLDADADLDEALELARKNAQVQPTPEARELQRSIETARAARAGASGR